MHVEIALHLAPRPGERFAAGDLLADAGNAVRFLLGPDDLAAELLAEGQIALHVIGMVMCVEDMRELPAPRLELPFDDCRIGRVNRGRGAALVVMDKQAVIVGPAYELVHFEV